MNKLNKLSKSIFEGNSKRGFWEDRINIPIKMKESGLFSDEEIKSVEDASKGQMLMLIVSEVAETLEANRGRTNTLNRKGFESDIKNGAETGYEKHDNIVFKEGFERCIKNSEEDEIADIIIRCLDYCGGFNIDIDWHIEQKLKYNNLRAYKHDKNY